MIYKRERNSEVDVDIWELLDVVKLLFWESKMNNYVLQAAKIIICTANNYCSFSLYLLYNGLFVNFLKWNFASHERILAIGKKIGLIIERKQRYK